jgi:sugar O-acyltransferase (sialic acid O-acetyltransferase NeuD family)
MSPAAADHRGARRILIVGAGGFGREVLAWARAAWPEAAAKLGGFLAEERGECCSLPIVASPALFAPHPDDALVLAIGIPDVRRRVAEALLARGGRFLTLIHPTAIVAASASIGEGSVLCPYSIASDATTLGRFTLLNYHASLGHDASTGDFSVLAPYATLGGGARIAADVFMGLHTSVAPGKSVGASSKVSANSACLADVPAGSLVFGVPGRVTRRLDMAASSSDPPGGPSRS